MQLTYYPSESLNKALREAASRVGAHVYDAPASRLQKAVGFGPPSDRLWLLSGEFVQVSPQPQGLVRLWYRAAEPSAVGKTPDAGVIFIELRKTVKRLCTFDAEAKAWVPRESETDYAVWRAAEKERLNVVYGANMQQIRQWKAGQ